MGILKPSKFIEEWTAKEMHEFCKKRVSAWGGNCDKQFAGECPIFDFCGQCPCDWPIARKAQFSKEELAVMTSLYGAGVQKIIRTSPDSVWCYQGSFQFFLPGKIFPSLQNGFPADLEEILGS